MIQYLGNSKTPYSLLKQKFKELCMQMFRKKFQFVSNKFHSGTGSELEKWNTSFVIDISSIPRAVPERYNTDGDEDYMERV